MNAPSAAARRAASTPKAAPSEDRLEKVREQLRVVRDLDLSIGNFEEKLKTAQKARVTVIHETLPAMFAEVGIDKLGLPAEGNLPAYDAALGPYYKASISAEWPSEKQDAAFDWLEKHEHGDLIKNTFVIELGRDDAERARDLRKALEKAGFAYANKRAVSWNTLTAWLKEQVEKVGTTPPLDLLGATVGSVVKLKERKEK